MEEKEMRLLEKQLERHKQNKIKLSESLEYNKDVIKMNKINRDFNDKWTDYKRRLKEEEENQGIKMIEEELNNIEQHIKEITKQLKEQPEVKSYHT
ncbi:MAG: hypothetical protein AABY22_27835 [Nanoarchaeota archaeon]